MPGAHVGAFEQRRAEVRELPGNVALLVLDGLRHRVLGRGAGRSAHGERRSLTALVDRARIVDDGRGGDTIDRQVVDRYAHLAAPRARRTPQGGERNREMVVVVVMAVTVRGRERQRTVLRERQRSPASDTIEP